MPRFERSPSSTRRRAHRLAEKRGHYLVRLNKDWGPALSAGEYMIFDKATRAALLNCSLSASAIVDYYETPRRDVPKGFEQIYACQLRGYELTPRAERVLESISGGNRDSFVEFVADHDAQEIDARPVLTEAK
jgi:hypothetical protein